MIKFFRHIRQNLIMENKTSKYFKYAIGEIVLVVIGILIALQINNWNNNRQNKILEKQNLVNIKNDLILQSEIIQNQINKEKSFIEHTESCLKMVNSKIDINEMANLMDSLSVRSTFVSNRVTFDNLGSNGKATVISNSELQNEIVRYYQSLEYTQSVVNNNNLYRVNSQFGTYVLNNDLGININKDGQVYLDNGISPEQKYRLIKQLEGRRYSAENNSDKCILQLDNTMVLINAINDELENND